MHELAFTDGNRNQKPWPHGVQLRERDPGEVDWDSMEGGERRGGEEERKRGREEERKRGREEERKRGREEERKRGREEERKMETRNEEFTSCRCGEEHLVDLRWQEEGG
jgi:hypothetical protein